MKDYLRITKPSQVTENDNLVDFYENEVWHKYSVYEIKPTGITLHCKSGALLFISKDRLENEGLFKRIF